MSADLPKIRNWNREQQAQRIAELEFDNSNLKAVIDRLHLDYQELEAEVSANLQERVRMQAVINAFENGDRVSKYAPDTPEIAALREDAERYRWLRNTGQQGWDGHIPQRGITVANGDKVKLHFIFWMSKEELDAAIDAARGG